MHTLPRTLESDPTLACFSLRADPLLYLVLIKGCTQAANQEARVTDHRAGPGLSIVSYTRVCRENLCNDLSTSLPLWTPLPRTGAGGWGEKGTARRRGAMGLRGLG